VKPGCCYLRQNYSRQIRNFVNPEKRSNIENVAPDPGNCTRVKFVAAQQGPDFLLSAARLARTPQAGGTARLQENYSPTAICPA
jgi:hypothetical protein